MSTLPPELQATRIIDATHPRVVDFTRSAIGSAANDRDRAVRLYYAVRDGIRYDPLSLSPGTRVADGEQDP